MSLNTIALVAGLLAAPAWLVWVGHGLRHKGTRTHRMFWWAVIGNSVAIAIMCLAFFMPPLMWKDDTLRAFAIHWTLLIGTLAGALIGRTLSARGAP